MKIAYLIVGLLVGGMSGFFGTRAFYHTDSPTQAGKSRQDQPDMLVAAPKWKWPDGLDAVNAAPESHKIVYEDSAVRVLQVLLKPKKAEPMHTHKWKSVMWFTQATPMIYYRGGLANNKYMPQDSMVIGKMPPEALNHGEILDAEEPHAIRNLSDKAGIAYRVEFKK